MPLSEHEQRLFSQIERSLLADPKFDDAVHPLKWYQLHKRVARWWWRLWKWLGRVIAGILRRRRPGQGQSATVQPARRHMAAGSRRRKQQDHSARWFVLGWAFCLLGAVIGVLGVWKAIELIVALVH